MINNRYFSNSFFADHLILINFSGSSDISSDVKQEILYRFIRKTS